MRQALLIVCAVAAACGGNGDGAANPSPAAGGAESTPIFAVQGNAAASPMQGRTVRISGVVSGDFQDNDSNPRNNLGGFYLQDEAGDGDPSTSDGIFVFDGSNPAVDVRVGDRVDVTGTVAEYFGETQISPSMVTVSGSGNVQALDVFLPATSTVVNSDGRTIADLEHLEGMLVRFPQVLTVAELRNLERYGEVQLVSGGRAFSYTSVNAPSATGYAAHLEELAGRRLVLDDGLRSFAATPVRYLGADDGAGHSLRVGDELAGLVGNIRFARGSGDSGTETYRLMPTVNPEFTAANPRPAAPDVAGSLTVASFNVLNFFTTIDTGENTCGPFGNGSCRGADNARELERQLEKTLTALTTIDADIVGLVELENNRNESLQHIVDGLNRAAGAGTYAYVDTGTIGTDSIKTGFLYKPGAVSPVGDFALLDASVDSRFLDQRNRPALAQTFRQQSNGAKLTIVINHLKSKGSACDGDPDAGDGQGNCNMTRTDAVLAMIDWLDTDPTGSGDTDILVIGDLNAYIQEDPLVAFESAGYVNLIGAGPGSAPYSFVFDGQSGALDHALASPSLVPQVTAAIEWHINADEAPARDYNLDHGRDASLFDGDSPFRASDHDPIVVGLELVN